MTDDRKTARAPGRLAVRCRAGTMQSTPAGSAGAEEADMPAEREQTGLDIDVRPHGDTVVAAISGEIDLNTADALRKKLRELDAAGHRSIVVDFSGVNFCDATGIGVLVAAHNRSTDHGGSISLAGVRPAQRRLLVITGLLNVFTLYAGVEEALAQTAGSPADSPAT
ncbi:STAS domain-containing protein [Actinomadura barringtoniae]|uniref:Anti-sigma factor antagonist n=1 Tax=Actinomadura barringtoniae TaxID=1427535 RepID=A0A939PPF5_9ACTN|nr:STAS domain-containing protein [Actinomadura barringtoniae]MBO2452794.1 STAS domain-containing protein [Actinomadura barringtoniae]